MWNPLSEFGEFGWGFVKGVTPRYGRWCGPGYSGRDEADATLEDVPIDCVDCLGWLHDNETGRANDYGFPNNMVCYNTANLVWVDRNSKMDEVWDFANLWWRKRLTLNGITGLPEVLIPKTINQGKLHLYKPGSRTIFRVLSIHTLPFMRNVSLLKDSIDESLIGSPPY